MMQINKNKKTLGSDVNGGYSPTTKIYQNIGKNMGIVKDTGTVENQKTFNSDLIQKPSTPTTSPNDSKSILDVYREEASKLQANKEQLNSKDEYYDIEKDTINSKIESTNAVLDAYMKNAEATQSAKVASQTAQQNAMNSTQAYLKAAGLAGQGVSESTMANMGNNYANSIADIHASENENNANAQASYIDALKQADSERQARISEKELVNEAKKENEMNEYYEYLLGKEGNLYNQNDGSIDNDLLDVYKQEIDKAYEEGKISETRYNILTDTYKNIGKEYEKQLNAKGFGSTSENPQGEKLSPSDVISMNNELDSKNVKAVEGLTYEFNGKEIVYKNGEWRYMKQYKTSDGGLSAETVREEDFGKFVDTGKKDSKQSKYVNAIIQAGKDGFIPDGTIINFNYGFGVIHNYEYKNGAWYKASRQPNKKTYNEKNIETLIGKINY